MAVGAPSCASRGKHRGGHSNLNYHIKTVVGGRRRGIACRKCRGTGSCRIGSCRSTLLIRNSGRARRHRIACQRSDGGKNCRSKLRPRTAATFKGHGGLDCALDLDVGKGGTGAIGLLSANGRLGSGGWYCMAVGTISCASSGTHREEHGTLIQLVTLVSGGRRRRITYRWYSGDGSSRTGSCGNTIFQRIAGRVRWHRITCRRLHGDKRCRSRLGPQPSILLLAVLIGH